MGMDKRLTQAQLVVLLEQQTKELWQAAGEIGRSEERLRRAQEQWVARFLRAARFKDDETAGHIDRMSRYCELLARDVLNDSERAYEMGLASKLHDIGKVGIPDEILLKAGPLTPEETDTMRTHTSIGYGILAGESGRLVDVAATIALG